MGRICADEESFREEVAAVQEELSLADALERDEGAAAAEEPLPPLEQVALISPVPMLCGDHRP